MRASRDARRRGFILPTTLLVMTLVTVMLAAAFVLVSAEYRVTDNSFASSRALAIAQAGMQNYFSAPHNLSGTPAETTYTFTGGYARVLAQRLRDSTTTAPKTASLWVVRAIGYDTVRAASGQPNGQRAIAQFAQFQAGILPGRAAMTAANGVSMSATDDGYPNPITGMNTGFAPSNYNPSCTAPSGAAADTFGLSVPVGEYVGTGGRFPGGEGAGGTNTLASDLAVIDSTRIDWAALLGGQFTPDFVNQLPSAGNNTYQTHYFPGNVTIPTGQRRGLLLTLGNVTLASEAHWDGIIIAGGKLDASGSFSFTIHGMIITGLNVSLGQNPGKNQVRRGAGRVIQWDYCYARSATGSLSYLIPIKNAWVDNWSTY